MNAVDIALFLVDRRANAASFHDLPEAWKRQPISDRLLKLQQENISTANRDDEEPDNRITVNAPPAAAADTSNTGIESDARAPILDCENSRQSLSAAANEEMPEFESAKAPREGADSCESVASYLFDEAAADSLMGLRVLVASPADALAQPNVFGTVIGWCVLDASKRGLSSKSNAKRSTLSANTSQENSMRRNGQCALVHHIQLDRAKEDTSCPNTLVELTYAEVLIAHGRALMANTPHESQNITPLLLPRQPANAPNVPSISFGDSSCQQEAYGDHGEFYDAEDDTK